MSSAPIYIAGMGIISALGRGTAQTIEAIKTGRPALGPLTLFPVLQAPSPIVGQVKLAGGDPLLPRTHQLACIAADEALCDAAGPPDAIVLGTTTGGILTTEPLLQDNCSDPQQFRYHALETVARTLAVRYGCTGPAVTVSTACSSGAVALKIAMQMLSSGMAKRVLAGGADALCRLTYFGFKSLQLIDPLGARPLDRDRRGMSIAEGAALLWLTSDPPDNGALQLLGAGWSCDAHHATTPHPEGEGALAAMKAALAEAGLSPADVDYINLHGTGTLDNDLAEARAIHALFGDDSPPLSSTKGATGHALAAAGAIETVIAALGIQESTIPANVGCRAVDPDLNVTPVSTPLSRRISTVMSNSLGFGGNNAALLVGTSRGHSAEASDEAHLSPLVVTGYAAVTGAGHTAETRDTFLAGRWCGGCLDDGILSEGLPLRTIRRLKRLPKMALALATNACRQASAADRPAAISLGTGWGALSETYDFLQRLFETDQAYPSPTDFIGSVHNAPAGQIAMLLNAKGANVTASGGDYSFEQALLIAELATRNAGEPILVLGVDETHTVLSPLFDSSVRIASSKADGGGALLLRRSTDRRGPAVSLVDYRSSCCPKGISGLVERLGGAQAIDHTVGAVLAGLPAAHREQAGQQLSAFLQASRFDGPVIDYRHMTGEFAGASAVAAVAAVEMVEQDVVPAPLAGGKAVPLMRKGILILGLGPMMTGVRVAVL